MIIDENQLSSAHNILSTTKLKIKQQQKQPPHNNRPKRLLLQASSYLSIEHKYQHGTELVQPPIDICRLCLFNLI